MQSLKEALEEFISQREVLEPNQETLEAVQELQEGRGLKFSLQEFVGMVDGLRH
ncbi:hypothetical protein NHP21005_19500 (plasmid) [Helicobacter sp. NHP21005]|uniref:hypothetical protein n=1 Tax=Helicobacter felistomachi TaxID=3040201 RepID=UPI002573EE12|nr:hypothetical protein [Helicobacter sp. NHP21005]BEG58262.1 hypothetical protein NHP21005_19500 [Helicobacter sp. NHP21005]